MKFNILFKHNVIHFLIIVHLNFLCETSSEIQNITKSKPNQTESTTINIKTSLEIDKNKTAIKENAGLATKVERKKKTMKDFKNTRRSKTHRSTSSSGNSRPDKTGDSQSLDMTSADSSSTDGSGEVAYEPAKGIPPSDNDRRGWRRWHRRCTVCYRDMIRSYRDQRVNWICGAYQRARRSFKSECMMYYRNCQDGTMFVKIHDHRCENNTYHGHHFFYDYKVAKSGETSISSMESSEDLFSYENDGPTRRPIITQFMDITLRPIRGYFNAVG